MVFQMQAVPLFLHSCDKTSRCHVVFTCDYYSMLYIIHCRMFDWSSDSVHFEKRMNYVYYAPLSVANVMMWCTILNYYNNKILPVVAVNSLTVFFFLQSFIMCYKIYSGCTTLERERNTISHSKHKNMVSISHTFSVVSHTIPIRYKKKHEKAEPKPTFRAAICCNCWDELYIFNAAQSLDEEWWQGGFYVDRGGFLSCLKEDCGSVPRHCTELL